MLHSKNTACLQCYYFAYFFFYIYMFFLWQHEICTVQPVRHRKCLIWMFSKNDDRHVCCGIWVESLLLYLSLSSELGWPLCLGTPGLICKSVVYHHQTNVVLYNDFICTRYLKLRCLINKDSCLIGVALIYSVSWTIW